MKASFVKKLFINSIKQHLITQEWNVKNHLIYKDIKSGLLTGVCFNSSSFSPNQFEPIAFIQPLFVPLDFIVLGFNFPLKNPTSRQWWNYDENNLDHLGKVLADSINQADKEFFLKIDNALAFYKYYEKAKKTTIRHFEAVAYSSAYARLPNAKLELNELQSFIKKNENVKIDWVKKIYDNAEELLKGDSQLILQEWEKETRRLIKI